MTATLSSASHPNAHWERVRAHVDSYGAVRPAQEAAGPQEGAQSSLRRRRPRRARSAGKGGVTSRPARPDSAGSVLPGLCDVEGRGGPERCEACEAGGLGPAGRRGLRGAQLVSVSVP